MGPDWVTVRDAARHGTLSPGDDAAQSIAARLEQLVEYLCLHLSQELGVDVKHLKPRGKGARDRVAETTRQLAEAGLLNRSIKVPGAVSPITLSADLRARLVTTSIEIDAPQDRKRAKAKVNWVLRQLREAPDDLRIDVRFVSTRSSTSELLGDCREQPDALLLSEDPRRDPRAFILARSLPMGKKAGLDKGSFVAELRRQTTDFYRELVQDLRPPPTAAPKLPEKGEPQPQEQARPDPEASATLARREQTQTLSELESLDSAGLLSDGGSVSGND